MLLGLGSCARDRAVAAVAVGGRARGAPVRRPSRRWRAVGARGTEAFTTQGTRADQARSVRLPVLRCGNTQRMLEMVEVPPHPPERFESVLEPEPFETLADGIRTARELLGERTVWNVSSTAKGGGVVELLLPLIGYAKGAGVDARWAVIEGNPDFFKVTKRIHNFLHGFEGDGGDLDEAARKIYEDALEPNAAELVELVDADDVVLLHDPQTAGLIGPLKRTGAKVIWRCHIGIDNPHDLARRAWEFLRVDVEQADAYVFSREAFVWEGSRTTRSRSSRRRSTPSTPRTRSSSDAQVHAILAAAGIVDGGGDGRADLQPRGRQRGARGEPGPDLRGRAPDPRGPRRPPGLALGPPQGPRGRDPRVRRARLRA